MRVLFNKLIKTSPFQAKLLIKGKTFKESNSISCQVNAYNRKSGLLLSSGRSNSSGDYILFGVQRRENMVIALDPGSEFNLAAQDNVI